MQICYKIKQYGTFTYFGTATIDYRRAVKIMAQNDTYGTSGNTANFHTLFFETSETPTFTLLLYQAIQLS